MSQSNIPKLEDLPDLNRPALVEAWIECFGRPPPKKSSRKLLIGAIAWQLQARRYGSLKAGVRRRLERFAEASKADRKAPAPRPTPRFRPGARLVREWHGRTHTVDVLEDGFLHNGKRHRSLSEVARVITGARWSGPRFFGR